MQFDFYILFFTILGSLLLGSLFILAVRGRRQRLLLGGFLAGYLFYSGIGMAYPEVPLSYLFFYFSFFIAFALAFWFFSAAFAGISEPADRFLAPALNHVETHALWAVVICLYLLLHLLPLLYPEFRLHHLLAPSPPDVITALVRRFEPRETNILLKLADYTRLSLMPFFYIALFRYRGNLKRILFLLLLLNYIRHVDAGYVGRGYVIMDLALIGIFIWESRPRSRRLLVAASAALLPLLLVASYIYGMVRIGGTVGPINPLEAIGQELELEMSFFRSVGLPLLESGSRVDLAAYFKWLFTLPLPKIFTGEIEVARINYDIARIVLGLDPGTRGWYVALSGLLSESIYIFGSYFFWLHAVFLAFLAALVGRLLERTPQLAILRIYVVLLFTYVLNRAGVSALLPYLINNFLLFYIFVLAGVMGILGKGGEIPPAGLQPGKSPPGVILRKAGDRQMTAAGRGAFE